MSDDAKAKIWLVLFDYDVVAVFDDDHKDDAERTAKLIDGRVWEEHPVMLNPTHAELSAQLRIDRSIP